MPLRNNTAKGGSSPASCSPSSAHDKAWEKGFIVPIAKEMKARGVAYLLITIRDDGKAAYVLEPVEAECEHTRADGSSAITDRGFIYPNYSCRICGKEFGENLPGNSEI